MAVKLGLRLQKSVLSDMYTGQSVNQNGQTIIEFDGKERKAGITDSAENKLEYFRKLMLEHLDALEKEDVSQLKKALEYAESLVKGGMSVGTVREWKGKKYKKIAPGKWRPIYESETRGAKMAISVIKKKIIAAKDKHEMMQIVLENRSRFSDKNGNPLPFMQELSEHIRKEQKARGEQDSAVHEREKTESKESQKKEALSTLKSWANDAVFDEAEGMSQEEIFEKYGNKLFTIAILPKELLSLFNNISDTNIYCGKGYFVDHMVNHHPEIDLNDYVNIQETVDEHKNVYEESQTNSILFEKDNRGKKEFLVLKLDNEKRITFYKTFYYGKKIPKKLKKIDPAVNTNDKQGKVSDVGERSTISRSDIPNPAASISARSDNSTIPQTPEKSSAKSNDIKKSVFAVLRSIPLPQLVKSLMNLEDKTA